MSDVFRAMFHNVMVSEELDRRIVLILEADAIATLFNREHDAITLIEKSRNTLMQCMSIVRIVNTTTECR